MTIALFRIDDRLIHGQVVESWIPHLQITETVVISEEVVTDEIRRTLMRISLPEEIALKIMNAQAAAEYFKNTDNDKKRILVLVPGPAEVLDLLRRGINIQSVNVGGMHYSASKMQIGRAIFLSEEDCKSFKDIALQGVRLEGKGVPSDKALDIVS